jgi:hypothetical protein
MSVACPQIEGIRYVKLDDDHWKPHLHQIEPALPATEDRNPKADNYAPGEFTGGSQPEQVNRVIPAPRMGGGEAGSRRNDAAGRTVREGNIQP